MAVPRKPAVRRFCQAMSEDARNIIIHGHFYQPPRESPWTGLVAPEANASPFANWNERILSECYAANAHAHIMEGRVIRIRNNYEALNFNFGPTLNRWLARHGSSAYRSILRADAHSGDSNDGYGNAIAQSYSHSILPLLPSAAQETEIAWGIADFRFRFGREPEGLWLPECAADAGVLGAVARASIKFVILAPWQGTFTLSDSALGEHGAGPFIWNDGDQSVAVFRYDRDLSGFVSFRDALNDGERLARAIIDRAHLLPPGATLLIAVDGETFGHHRRKGAAELARALAIISGQSDLRLSNCAEVLARRGTAGGFEIERATSWSCPHGVERWRSDCGCRLTPGTSQQWRGELRDAMEMVRAHADLLYEREARRYLSDPLSALRESIILSLDPAPERAEQFFIRHKVADEAARDRLRTLFEMQRAAHAALTSCGWFFDDFTGPEGRIVLRWAVRAVELAAVFAPTIEPQVLMLLRPIRSNRRELGDAATLYLSLKTREARGRI